MSKSLASVSRQETLGKDMEFKIFVSLQTPRSRITHTKSATGRCYR